ncbi:glutamate-1-semialdehyde 2,1-aminomutase [Kiloniella litopenaei]|uniref:glutamate-1-semialdehyde 2,1-aminomutase n=1 Tax=Kiloniella litopenaei TaxID=1549748 RepID=UPI003BACC5BE
MFNQSAHNVIPGGAHTYSKGDDQFPETAPQTIEQAKDSYVFDGEGRRYVDWTMGLRSTPLGYGNAVILNAVKEQLDKGPNFPRPSSLEEKTGRHLLSCVPDMDMVKFAKNGSNVTTAAVKLARAYTGRDLVACCSDHPFFSFDDWFIGSTKCPAGVPQDIRKLTLTFQYNNIESLEKLFDTHKGKISCVIMEAVTDTPPTKGFLEKVQNLCKTNGALFIVDEMITGFRFSIGGASSYFNLKPDMMTFGKGMGNGFSVAALAGKRDIMEQGGISPGEERLFLLSATHGAENHSLAAANAAIKLFKKTETLEKLWNAGARLKVLINDTAKSHDLSDYIQSSGYDCSPVFYCKDSTGKPCPKFRTLFLQEMARNDVLINFIAPSITHNDEVFDLTHKALLKTLPRYYDAIKNGVDQYLEGSVILPVFRARN